LGPFAFSLPEDVHGRPGSRLYVHNVQQVLQDVEQLFEAQVRTASVQVSLVSVRCVQGLHSTRPSGRAALQVVVYPCGSCGKTFKWKKSLVRHEREECGRKQYQCPQCLRLMNRRDSLIRHLRLKHGQDCRVKTRVMHRSSSLRAKSCSDAALNHETTRLPRKFAKNLSAQC
ncbi:zinc finger and SCAN domain-containing protein 32-like, partial [Frieseomelitta varia]|uniref:zinc finger and SCAN domain-containing protein 32-like n=1 Tax=Frieseomelitta varia TaxID=561572 RepID=UPI001CB68D5D